MVEINLKDYYYWCITDEFVEVSDEVAAELRAGKRYEAAYRRRMKRNKVNSLDAGDHVERAVCVFEPSPELCLVLMDQYQRLCCALNALPDAQGRRIEAHYLLGLSVQEIAEKECVTCRAVQASIKRGLKAMRKYF
ncbi:sigma factor-like helix-turn-helix DNA-binding protein [Agathobaculum sp. LCP25S3_E8]|uniref:sigma factor-like helix-turn-helix DNA-binding protein n=1 Tax=Agathobaculum sp. LCP25S3_E8 TaxID=3438735 RepID=UPI003F9390AD